MAKGEEEGGRKALEDKTEEEKKKRRIKIHLPSGSGVISAHFFKPTWLLSQAIWEYFFAQEISSSETVE